MQHSLIPTCYFPTTVLFIDENRNFLLNFVLQLDEWLAYRVFDSPLDGLNHIHKNYDELKTLNKRCINKFAELKKYKKIQNLNAVLHSEIYNPRRFSEISVVVIDYDMPEMNGLEFCRKISHTPIKKILLIRKEDERQAIEAFNSGLIDCYTYKNNRNVAHLITQSIQELQWQYFQEMSELIHRELSLTLPACLQDREFTHFFKQLCHDKSIVEFYLTEDTGNFLLLDQDAQISFLIVKSDEERMFYLEDARSDGASDELIKQLSKGEKIPYVNLLRDKKDNDWQTSLLPANQLITNKTYWYSYSQEPLPLLKISQEELLSYYHHLEELDAEELRLL